MFWFWHFWYVKMVWFWSLVRCQDGMVLIPGEKLRWYGFDTREMSICYSLNSSWDIKMVWFWYSWDVKMVWFWYSWDVKMVWFGPSWDVEIVWFWYSCDVEMVWICYSWDAWMVWFWILVRCKDGMVLILVRSGIVWFCPSWDVKMVWFWGSSWDVSLVWFFPREKSNPPDASRGSTTSHESYQTSHEGENPSWEVKYLELVLVGKGREDFSKEQLVIAIIDLFAAGR